MTSLKQCRPIPSSMENLNVVVHHVLSRDNQVIIIDDPSSSSSYSTVDYESYGIMKDAAVQRSRILTVQASTSTGDGVGLGWYILAILLWLMSSPDDSGVPRYKLIASCLNMPLMTSVAIYLFGYYSRPRPNTI